MEIGVVICFDLNEVGFHGLDWSRLAFLEERLDFGERKSEERRSSGAFAMTRWKLYLHLPDCVSLSYSCERVVGFYSMRGAVYLTGYVIENA